ncbi:MAG: hypothetical protein NW205_00950 [Hyphomicrobiaceae bacterium]|nr:hypothetical protein [Hyphomicrobiaceae bacterium]
MNARRQVCLALAAVAAMSGGCAQSPDIQLPALSGAGLQPISTALAQDDALEAEYARRKTFAGKVLTAIALERVTGRKPDPSRLSELD